MLAPAALAFDIIMLRWGLRAAHAGPTATLYIHFTAPPRDCPDREGENAGYQAYS